MLVGVFWKATLFYTELVENTPADIIGKENVILKNTF